MIFVHHTFSHLETAWIAGTGVLVVERTPAIVAQVAGQDTILSVIVLGTTGLGLIGFKCLELYKAWIATNRESDSGKLAECREQLAEAIKQIEAGRRQTEVERQYGRELEKKLYYLYQTLNPNPTNAVTDAVAGKATDGNGSDEKDT